ncbi:MAG TPA: penicillin-binding transpeptidase domain-containing protein, partial [Methylibium sp.]|nr:penicillin-binding transpeptidase domain-containing protein [Methylibium sp.]
VSARSALGASLNVPAVRVGQLVGVDALFERLNAVGLDLPHGGGHYGASLALGSADVSLLALANAYRTLANGGLHGPLRWQPGRAAAPQRVADAAAVQRVTDILADNEARALTFGLDSVLATRGWAAVKTGTSKDLRDNWCIGWTDRWTVGVWVGNADGDAMHAVSGVEGAAPVWQRIVGALHEGAPSRRPAALPATATTPVAPALPAAPFGITHPRDGSVFALDPDIPPAAQRVRFEGEKGQWELDGRRLGRGERLHWAPQPGQHRLRLLAADGRTVLGEAAFEVRGAHWKAAAAPR